MSAEHDLVSVSMGRSARVSCPVACRQAVCNMQMNKPLWIVEDAELGNSPEGRQKLQDTVTDKHPLEHLPWT